ncbi:unnamed protein product [Danaus chrysippus]|uniref:(African queen) hypothetical protein n=1 Tax=Danaus chrysippus TaxID=151541 RepID=A0A8J2W0H2_9NEOP|nr:unnamed protein product [Danaus chrysippus]
MPISFSHKIYGKSCYQPRIDGLIQQTHYMRPAYRELFMRDQIDWFGDNIGVPYCNYLKTPAKVNSVSANAYHITLKLKRAPYHLQKI